MSSASDWMSVCALEHSVSLDANKVCTPVARVTISPIDDFYAHLAALIPLGGEQELRNNTALGGVLLLGVVSATEQYFRALIAGLVRVCPVVRKLAAPLPLSFGALDYYRPDELGLALLEHVSLATAGEVRKQTQKLLGIDTKQESSTDAALKEYEKLCQLRHAAVHAHGELGHQNLQELGFLSSPGRLALRIELPGFHSAADVCNNVVRAYNRLLYRRTVERWIGEKALHGTWGEDAVIFTAAHALFYSRTDAEGPGVPYNAYRKFLPTLKKALAKGQMTA